jgi:hypothetical protein
MGCRLKRGWDCVLGLYHRFNQRFNCNCNFNDRFKPCGVYRVIHIGVVITYYIRGYVKDYVIVITSMKDLD